jgi:hypothetical protein
LTDADEALLDEYTDHQMYRLERELLGSPSVRIGSPSGVQSTNGGDPLAGGQVEVVLQERGVVAVVGRPSARRGSSVIRRWRGIARRGRPSHRHPLMAG